jgi:hypothetical protein
LENASDKSDQFRAPQKFIGTLDWRNRDTLEIKTLQSQLRWALQGFPEPET